MENRENKVKKFRFNIIDFLVIVAVLACIVGVALRYNVVEKISENTALEEYDVSFVISGIKLTSVDALIPGDSFYWTQTNELLGVLKSKDQPTPTKVYYSDANGVLVENFSTNRYDVRGILGCDGVMTDDGFMIGGNLYVAPGKSFLLESPHLQVTVQITDIAKAVE